MILKHLLKKENHQESLDGLILEIYNSEIKELSKEISKSLRYLIAVGLIVEVESSDSKKRYKLLKDKREVYRFLNQPI